MGACRETIGEKFLVLINESFELTFWSCHQEKGFKIKFSQLFDVDRSSVLDNASDWSSNGMCQGTNLIHLMIILWVIFVNFQFLFEVKVSKDARISRGSGRIKPNHTL